MTGTSSGNVALATTGNVGIGITAPSQKLEVAGNAVINAGGNYTSLRIGTDANDTILSDNTAGKSYG